MPDNPYTPPEAPLAHRDMLEASGSFDVMQCVSEAWDDTWSNFPVWLGVMLVGSVLSLLTLPLFFLFWPVIGFGMVLFYLHMTDQQAAFGDIFAGFPSFGRVFITGLLLFVMLFVIGLVGQSVQIVGQLSGSAVLEALGVVVNLAWSLTVMLRLYFSVLFWVDRDMGPVEALQTSWEVTRGQTLHLIGLVLAGFVIIFLGLLALVVGVIPAINMNYLLWTSAYRQMVGRSAAISGT